MNVESEFKLKCCFCSLWVLALTEIKGTVHIWRFCSSLPLLLYCLFQQRMAVRASPPQSECVTLLQAQTQVFCIISIRKSKIG